MLIQKHNNHNHSSLSRLLPLCSLNNNLLLQDLNSSSRYHLAATLELHHLLLQFHLNHNNNHL